MLFSHILLVSGTLRSNLDPFGEHDDATLWDALKRAYLVENTKPGLNEDSTEASSQGRFTLDSQVEDEGSNLSLGQVRLLYLLLRIKCANYGSTAFTSLTCSRPREGIQGPDFRRSNRPVIFIIPRSLANVSSNPASVDYETDKKIQDTIAHEFADRTILCIARTISLTIPHSAAT
jgi:hypothetical protein